MKISLTVEMIEVLKMDFGFRRSLQWSCLINLEHHFPSRTISLPNSVPQPLYHEQNKYVSTLIIMEL